MRGILFIAALFLSSCAQQSIKTKEEVALRNYSSKNDFQLASVLWYQQSGELIALCHQAFKLAKLSLEMKLQQHRKQKNKKLRPAIIIDIDETVLDNSPYQAENILHGTRFPIGWNEWMELAHARAIPGAKSFLKYADSRGVEIFYVTNRQTVGLIRTMKNLKDLGIPYKRQNLLLRSGTASKKERKDFVRKDYDVLLYIGDNLDDFTDDFEGKSVHDRKILARKYEGEWGNSLIVLPNPMYGSWEQSVYDYKPKREENELMNIRKDYLVPPSKL